MIDSDPQSTRRDALRGGLAVVTTAGLVRGIDGVKFGDNPY